MVCRKDWVDRGMAASMEAKNDHYAILGLPKDCTGASNPSFQAHVASENTNNRLIVFQESSTDCESDFIHTIRSAQMQRLMAICKILQAARLKESCTSSGCIRSLKGKKHYGEFSEAKSDCESRGEYAHDRYAHVQNKRTNCLVFQLTAPNTRKRAPFFPWLGSQ